MAEQKYYQRFTVAQRVEHWVMFASFTILAITGLPQKFVGNNWAETMIAALGGIEWVRVVHRFAAGVMALGAIYHFIAIAYKIYVQRVRWTMFPRFDDVLDALDMIRYNLGLTKERPKFDRFNFGEKFEYWAFVWGAIVMGLTGFMMWNPISTARFVPGDLIPAAKAAHGGEALLAVLAIVIWHFYNVHIRMFNKSIFTGKMSEHEMLEEHALELERIRQGIADKRPTPEVIKQRERAFIPIALFLSVFLLTGFYFFVAYEQTAITTLPRRATVQAFSPITPTPTLRPGQTPATSVAAAKPLGESHIGRTQCNVCHQTGVAGPKNPPDHQGRSDATCSACHKLSTGSPILTQTTPTTGTSAPASGGLKPLPASHAGRTTCNVCHETGMAGPKNPADHAGRTDATCSACHKEASGSAPAASTPAAKPAATGAAPATKPAATGAAPASGGLKPLPASHAGRAICNACHETGAAGPKNPADHAGRTDATCVACHKLP